MVKVIIPEGDLQRKHASAPEEFHAGSAAVPNAPPPNLEEAPPEYDSQNEVCFEVGVEGNTRIFPARRDLLQDKCPALVHLLDGQSYRLLRNVDPHAFEQLLRYLHKQSVTLTTVTSTLRVLEAARRFLVIGLVKQCINCLDIILHKNNVIAIYKYLHPFCSVRAQGFEPSAPPLEDDTNDARFMQLFNALYDNCLYIIDQNAYSILMGNDIETLTNPELLDILSRDTFYIKSEILVWDAMIRWCDFQCKESNMEVSSKARRYILGDLRYAIRYGLLSKDDFYKKVERSRVLEDHDHEQIWAFQKNKQLSLPHKMGRSRRKTVAKRLRRVCSSTDVGSHRQQPDNISTRSEGRCNFAQKCLMNCLSVWTALFD